LLAVAWVLPSIVGPAITGAVVEYIGWRWIFLGIPFFVAPAAVMLWRGLAGRPTAGPSQDDAEPSRAGFGATLAWGGVVAVGAALLQYGSGLGGRGLLLLGAGLVILAFALPRLLPRGTMRGARGFPTVVLLRGLAAGASYSADVFVPLMLTGERGLSPTLAGLFLTGSALSWSFASWIQGRRRYDRKLLLRGGTALLASGIAGTALLVFDAVPILAGLAAWLVAGFGIGLVYPTLSVLTLELSGPGEEGRNSSSLQIGESVFSVVIIAMAGAVFAAFDTAWWVYLACFGLIVTQAALGPLIAGRATR
jgi:MFS family permease